MKSTLGRPLFGCLAALFATAAVPTMAPAAHAAEINVSTPKTAWIYVNGDMVEYPPGGGELLKVEDLPQGTHQIVVRNWFGKKVASTTVELPYEGVAELKYANKQLTLISATPMKAPDAVEPGKVIMAGGVPSEADEALTLAEELGEVTEGDGTEEGTPAEVVVAGGEPGDTTVVLAEGASVTVVEAAPTTEEAKAVVISNAAEEAEAEIAPPITWGSLEFAGLEKGKTQVDVDGEAIMYYPDMKSFVAIKLDVGMHKVLVRTTAGEAFGGELEVRADANQRCEVITTDGGKDFDCEWLTPALGPR